ncbi:uncharacterized protein LOC116179083 isoform X1 [Photinus pyralis]|uniref:uncharacterized protein LOC116179083 isoform X1 n=2 Tax=Photinus pyralis TaxID=7054 RepID=UPI001266F789|nr:uncharacterized protein LOC116179083 isoform X1 [Photinus pyralis]
MSLMTRLNDCYDPMQMLFMLFGMITGVGYTSFAATGMIVNCMGFMRQTLAFQVIVPNFLLCWSLFWLDKLMNVSDDLLSFLFKYKISKLKKPAADEVELLIKTLIIRKPVMNASKIFVIHTGLLLPVLKTWFTYFLVGVQMLAAWMITEKVSC